MRRDDVDGFVIVLPAGIFKGVRNEPAWQGLVIQERIGDVYVRIQGTPDRSPDRDAGTIPVALNQVRRTPLVPRAGQENRKTSVRMTCHVPVQCLPETVAVDVVNWQLGIDERYPAFIFHECRPDGGVGPVRPAIRPAIGMRRPPVPESVRNPRHGQCHGSRLGSPTGARCSSCLSLVTLEATHREWERSTLTQPLAMPYEGRLTGAPASSSGPMSRWTRSS